mmetsp:Transcript_3257/g.5479  ORF Transcript_3257/g.5479 Transcript_3257/m.5479 type:complete len:606 (+) Transcript_3257:74-1891(+)
MQVDFAVPAVRSGYICNLERKSGTIVKQYRPRIIRIENGHLLCYAKGKGDEILESNLKDSDRLEGAVITSNGLEIKVVLKSDKKNPVFLRGKSANDVETFTIEVKKEITRINTEALMNGTKEPEVVEWFYRCQESIVRSSKFLTEPLTASMPSVIPGQNEARISHYYLTLVDDRSGILFSLIQQPTPSNPMHDSERAPDAVGPPRRTRTEAIYDGKIVHFADMLGVYLHSGDWMTDDNGDFQFTLQTKEDNVVLLSDGTGIEWLRAVQRMAVFINIPAPSSSPSDGRGAGGAEVTNLVDFRESSGAVFTVRAEVQLILHELASKPDPGDVILDFVKVVNEVLRAAPEVRCNREAVTFLGERVEDIVHTVGDKDTGVVFVLATRLPGLETPDDVKQQNEQFEALLGDVIQKLADIRGYLRSQRHEGWLRMNCSSEHPAAKETMGRLDCALMGAMNALLQSLDMDPALLFEQKEYFMARDVRTCVESLGGLMVIYDDTIKERALANLIQSDAAMIHLELQRMNGVMIRPSQQSMISSIHDELRDYKPKSKGCCYYLFCCCLFSCCCSSSGNSEAHNKAEHKQKYISAAVMQGYQKNKGDEITEPLVT